MVINPIYVLMQMIVYADGGGFSVCEMDFQRFADIEADFIYFVLRNGKNIEIQLRSRVIIPAYRLRKHDIERIFSANVRRGKIPD